MKIPWFQTGFIHFVKTVDENTRNKQEYGEGKMNLKDLTKEYDKLQQEYGCLLYTSRCV